jgi:Uma2 family endonuclease
MSTVLKTKRLYTADDLAALPDDVHAELIAGKYVNGLLPGGMHGCTSMTILSAAYVFVSQHDLGTCFTTETGFLLSRNPDTVLAPDFAFIAKSRCPHPIPTGYIELCPDLILETRSPGDSTTEINAKIHRWLEYGAQIVWDLDPKASTITSHTSDGAVEKLGIDDTLTGGQVLPGFSLPIKTIFSAA